MKKTTLTIKPGRAREKSKGILSFKTGVIKPKRQRSKVRGDKYHDREKRAQLGDS